MPVVLNKGVCTGSLVALLVGCVGTPGVRYHFNPPADSAGYRFVIPRTVIKVSQASGAPAYAQPSGARAGPPSPSTADNGTKFSFTPVPVAYDISGNPLPVYSVTDDTGGWTWISTSITNVKYADYLIIQSIGTQVTDNRKDAIDTIVSLVGVAAGAFGLLETPQCPKQAPYKPLADFVIEDLRTVSASPIPAPNNVCWGYKITDMKVIDSTARVAIPADGSSALPTNTKMTWFPYPACRTVTISVFPCDTAGGAASCREPDDKNPHATAVVSVADGTAFRRIALPQKGKVEMHNDFCVADVTSDTSPLSSDWTLLSQAIKDVKSLKQKGSSSSTAAPKSSQSN